MVAGEQGSHTKDAPTYKDVIKTPWFAKYIVGKKFLYFLRGFDYDARMVYVEEKGLINSDHG